MSTVTRQLTCHRCGSSELTLRETRIEIAEWQEGLLLTEDGEITALGEGTFCPGDLQPGKTEIECDGCGHVWHPRREFRGAALSTANCDDRGDPMPSRKGCTNA